MRTPEFIQRCLDAGMPLDLALTAAKAFEAECEIALEQLLDVRREKERARQAKHRAKKNVGNVMSRDTTLDDVTIVIERDLTGEPTRVENTTSSSLRSEEELPPATPKGVSAPKGAETSRGTRLPDDWRPDHQGFGYAMQTLGPNVDPERELDRFRDYWRAVPGAKGRKADWPATWRNWIRRASENLPRKAHGPHTDQRQAAREDSLRAHHAGAMAALNRRLGPVG